MDYQQTLDYLYSSLPLFSRMGSAAFKKDLTNIRILCERLGNPQDKFKSIHVGGTNGKGSVSHMLAAIFQAAGRKTGLYTSPHLYDFRERIRINGDMVEKDFVVDFVDKIRPWIAEIEPSFFEITVAMAFEYFARQKVEIAIIEVGLGGRLDSTNIIRPELSVITNIGWDHMNMLGNTLEEIAAEKAGIIKQGTRVVIGESLPETKAVFERVAGEKQAAVYFAEDLYETISSSWEGEFLQLDVFEKDIEKSFRFQLDLPGIYQAKNLCTVLTAIEIFHHIAPPDWMMDVDLVQKSLRTVRRRTGLQGRWEVLKQEPLVVLEVAHNKNGIEEMIRHISQVDFQQLHIVMGMVKDKEAAPVLQLLPVDAKYYFTQAHIPRALDARELQRQGALYSLIGEQYKHVNDALHAAVAQASPKDLIVVCGSIFLVAEVDRELIMKQA